MAYNIAAFLFALAVLAGVVSLVTFVLSFAVLRIPRKTALYSLLGCFTVAFIAIIIAAATEPTATARPSGAQAARIHAPVSHAHASRRRSAAPANDVYSGDDPAKVATRYKLSSGEMKAVANTQRLCTAAQVDDERTRSAKDSMGVALGLERVAGEWEACDIAIQQTVDDAKRLSALSDSDYVGVFGVMPSHPLLEESGAYGSAGTEWQMFGQQGRAIEDLRNAVDVGRKMVRRGYGDEGRTVMSDNEAALHDAESAPGP